MGERRGIERVSVTGRMVRALEVRECGIGGAVWTVGRLSLTIRATAGLLRNVFIGRCNEYGRCLLFVLVTGLFASGIGCESTGDGASGVRQRQERALADPFSYGSTQPASEKGPKKPPTDVTMPQKQERTLKQDWENLINP